jgi:hypothetical protein
MAEFQKYLIPALIIALGIMAARIVTNIVAPNLA